MKAYRSKSRILVGFLFVFLISASIAVDYTIAKDSNIYEEIQRWEKVLAKVNRYYVEDVDAKKMVDASIDGMLDILDPHTVFFRKDDYDELMVHTKAEFGGLGITISVRDKILTVISPLPGTPAFMMGIMAGDKIVKINGVSTKGITVEKAVKKLRGKPGTKVTVTIDREGASKFVDYTITRAVIHVKSVPYVGYVGGSIGYVRLINFSRESGRELEEGIKQLEKSGNLSGLILDLRNNPGGLLTAAIEVSEKILGDNRLVVSTKGRVKSQNTEYKTRKKSVIGNNIPVVVLVNEGSASASEIVSGAIQDWDRGVIAGMETYGKGSVQTIIPVGMGNNSYLKLTTAHYYTPSGRCINKPENDAKIDRIDKDSLDSDTVKVAKEVYFTNGGRKVYGGGGITPDVLLKHRRWERLEEILERKMVFFKYSIKKMVSLREKKIKIDKDFKVTDKMIAEFKKYIDDEKIEYKTNTQLALENFKLVYDKEYGDSAGKHKVSIADIKEMKTIIKSLENKIEKEKEQDFRKSKQYIKRAIKRELLASAVGEKAKYAYILEYDPQVKEAIKIINDKENYEKLLQKKDK